jgi:cytochrome c-type biogenesis protein CcmE
VPKKLRLELGAVLILGALVYLGIQAGHSFSQYFIPVNQFVRQQARFSGQVVQVQGKLLADSVHYDAARQVMRFVLTAQGYRLPVRYVGAVPTEQYENASAIVQGRMGRNGVFQASEIMIQCPDHYKPVTVGAAAAGTQHD